MTPADLDKISKIVTDVIKSEDPFKVWMYFVVIIAAAALGFISSYFGSYLQKKGKNLATKEDFDNLLDQTRKTTEVTEAIKLELASKAALNNKVRREQFAIAFELFTKLGQICSNVNRLRYGFEVPPDFMKQSDIVPLTNDIVPLTEVYEEIKAKQFLIGDDLYQNLRSQADMILNLSNVSKEKEDTYKAKQKELEEKGQEFGKIMTRTFEIDKVINPVCNK